MALAVLAIGAALTMSLISGSLGNIRKVQVRTRTIQHAEAVMELSLLDESIRQPTTFTGDFEDGTRWSVRVDEYELPNSQPAPPVQPGAPPQATLPVRLFSYTVDVIGPDSSMPDYSLQTLKLVSVLQQATPARLPR